MKFATRRYPLILILLIMTVITLCGCGRPGDVKEVLLSTDTVPPTISSTYPADGAIGFAVNSAITATFSEAMDASTINTTTFSLSGGVTGPVTYDVVNMIATFTPSPSLAYSTPYTATITTGVKDAAGNAMAAAQTWTFTTGVEPDTTQPTVSSTSPANSASNVAVNTAITATFSETMDTSTVTTATFTLSGGVAGTVTYSGTTTTFTPSGNLAYSTPYTATISTGVKDAAGNAMASPYTWTFTTVSAPDTTPPTVSSTSPANSSTGVAVNTAITATFSETMDTSTITTATFTVAGVTGTVTYSGTTATFTPSSSLVYNTSYTATTTTGVKDAASNAMASNYIWTFTTALGTLIWDAPTTNADGTVLTNLAGYKIHYGTSTGSYTTTVDVGPATTYNVTGLSTGTYYFAVTAYDTLANESDYSNEVSLAIP